ncbi:hypothetical protein [Parabacteroides sp. PF5-6]|uniref:hypothetical protein n=1 Tax=Parabacteroides sp. PF5-6 TaxID=1742403 RepID=UPI0024054274|nr:hypothetical protein [Parabacteroides sp. PF5-6]MDF9830439.1 hypothetical protein [Parabacteroides sp. PF5-6]
MKQKMTKEHLLRPFKGISILLFLFASVFAAQAEVGYTLYYNASNGLMYKDAAFDSLAEDITGYKADDTNKAIFTLENFELTTTADIGLVLPAGVTLVLKGENTITATAKALYAKGDLSIEGTGSLTCTGNLYGMIVDENLTFSGGSVTANGPNPIFITGHLLVEGGTLEGAVDEGGAGVSAKTLTVTGGVLRGKGGTDIFGIAVEGTPTTTGCTITGGDDGYDDDDEISYGSYDGGKLWGYIIKGANTPAKYVQIAKLPNTFTLYYNAQVGTMYDGEEEGKEVTTGFSGSYSASKDGMTLTLEDFEFETTAAIGLSLPAGITLVLKGENAITAEEAEKDDQARAISTKGNLIIQESGSGSLTLTAESGEKENAIGSGLYVAGNLTLKSGTVVCEGGMYAVDIYQDLTINGGSLKGTATGTTASDSKGVGVTEDILITGGELEGIGGTPERMSNSYGVYSKNLTVTGGELRGLGGDVVTNFSFGIAVYGTKPIVSGCTIVGGEDESAENPLSVSVIDGVNVYSADGNTPAKYVQITGPSASEPGTYHSITLEVAGGIELYDLTAGTLQVAEGDHLFLQFLPEDRTLGADDILFLIDGVETAFTATAEGNYFSYILNPVAEDHTIQIALKEYTVTLTETEGVTYNVGAGEHTVAYAETFTFSLTLADGIDPEKVHVFANGVEILPNELRATILTYTIDRVITSITVVIEGTGGTTSNAELTHDVRVVVESGKLKVESEGQAIDVAVYTINGQNVVSLRGLRGSHTLTLPAGIYLVKAGDKVYKVSTH